MKPMTSSVILAVSLLAVACASSPGMQADAVANASLPAPVQVPSGERQKMWTRGSGEITYECREKKEMAGQYEWAFVGPVASLADANGKVVGKYYAGPTWESIDGSRVTAKQIGVAPHRPGSIPLQLVKADAAAGSGAMQGVTYIQRLRTVGGVAPATPCAASTVGAKEQVRYQADYVFYSR